MSTTYRDGKPVIARCWLFHRWGPWVQYEWRGLLSGMLGRPIFPHIEFTERRQHRTCVRCNYEQDQLVKNG